MLLEGKCKKSQLGFYFRYVGGYLQTVPVTWLWFKCEVNQKCIHPKSRCDLHPHPACVYNNTETGKNKTETGEMVAEDEEGCLKEGKEGKYFSNSLIDTSANLECESPIHNNNSTAIAIHSTFFNWTKFVATEKEEGYSEAEKKSYENNVIVIEAGTTVQIQAVKCNGISECWKGVDEADCGFSTFETMFYGNLYFLNFDFKFMYKFIIY